MAGKVCDDLGEKTFSLYVQNYKQLNPKTPLVYCCIIGLNSSN
jgi:hypothetical protein